MVRQIYRVAFLWGIIGIITLTVETALSEFFSPAFFYMVKALPLYETVPSILLLYLAYFLCPFFAGCLFTFILNYGYFKIRKRPCENERLTLLSTCPFLAVVLFAYSRRWITDSFYELRHLLLPALLLICAGFGIFAGLLAAGALKRTASLRRLFIRIGGPALLLLILGMVCPKIYFTLSAQDGKEDGPRIILITVDTVRADRLSSFGYKGIETSNMDSLAGRGVTFKQAISPCPLTNPTHASMLTGLYPQTHGVRDTAFMDPHPETLQRVFKRNGYITAAFVSGFVLKDYVSGMDKDFDLYEDRFSFASDGFKLIRIFEEFSILPISNLDRKADVTNRLVIPWIRRYGNRRFFLWLHYYDPHLPYEPPRDLISEDSGLRLRTLREKQWEMRGSKKEDLSDEVISEMSGLYDAEILFTDRCVGEVLDALKEAGLEDETLIVLTSDHGEGFDHDYYFDHGDRLYDSAIHVPLIFSYPGGGLAAGKEVREQVGLVDIAPTILSLAGLESCQAMEGRDLSPFLYEKGRGESFSVYSESPRRDNPASLGKFRCVRTAEGWKYIYGVEDSAGILYNIKVDPLERRDLIKIEAGKAAGLHEELFEWMKPEESVPTDKPYMDEQTKEKLRSLGYMQ